VKMCDICHIDLKGQDDAVYSPTTKAYFCPVPKWGKCAERAEKLYQKKQAA
jgi:hypothetical protein